MDQQLRAYEDECTALGVFTAQARLAVARQDSMRTTVAAFALLGLSDPEPLSELRAAIRSGGNASATFRALVDGEECEAAVRVETGAPTLSRPSGSYTLGPATAAAVISKLARRLEFSRECARRRASAGQSRAPVLWRKGARETYHEGDLCHYELLLALVSGATELTALVATYDPTFTSNAVQHRFVDKCRRTETLAEAVRRQGYVGPHTEWDPAIARRAKRVDARYDWCVCPGDSFIG
jgi:hypothetical protein